MHTPKGYDFGMLAKRPQTRKTRMGSSSRRRPRTARIGITGSLASGKTTVLKAFRKAGFAILSADDVVADIYRRLKFDKSQISSKASPTRAGIRKLEKWIHPLVKKEILRFIRRRAKKSVVVEVPLLFEAGFQKIFDLNLMIFAPKAARRKRAMKRGMSKPLFELLESLQWSPSKKAAMADFILLNESKKSLTTQAKRLSSFLKRKAEAL